MTPTPPEQVETTDAADLLVDLELARLGDYPGAEGCKRMARALETLTAKLSASEAEVEALRMAISWVEQPFVDANIAKAIQHPSGGQHEQE